MLDTGGISKNLKESIFLIKKTFRKRVPWSLKLKLFLTFILVAFFPLVISFQNFSTSPIGTMNTSALNFIPLIPCRVLDTRTGAQGGRLLAGTIRNFSIAGSCGVPTTAVAYSFNVAVVPAGQLSLILWPTGLTQPNTAVLNSDGNVKSSGAIIAAGNGGSISAYSNNSTDLTFDVNGYFVPVGSPSSLAFYPVTPCRLVDTRLPNSTSGGPMLSAGQTRSFPALGGACGIPSTAQAYSLNITAVPPTSSGGYLTVWPTGYQKPLASSLNDPLGRITANGALVQAGTGGEFNIYAAYTTNVLVDINGYFAPPAAGGLDFFPIGPCRAHDTRYAEGSFSGTLPINITQNNNCGIPVQALGVVGTFAVVPSSILNYLTLWAVGAPRPIVSTLNDLDGIIATNMAIVPMNQGSINAYATNSTNLVVDAYGYFAKEGTTVLSGCADIHQPGTYLLSSNISGGNGCITIHDTNSVKLDCQNHSISTSGSTVVNVINVQGASIRNCTLNGGPYGGPIINVLNSPQSNISHNTIGQDVSAINYVNVAQSDSLIFTNNTVWGSYQQDYSSFATISSNSFTCTSSNCPALVDSESGGSNEISSNTMDGRATSAAELGSDDGVLLADESNDKVVSNNIHNVWDTGIETLGNINNALFWQNTINSAFYSGIGGWWWNNLSNSTISSNTITNTPQAFAFFRYCGLRAAGWDQLHLMPADTGLYFQNNHLTSNNFSSPNVFSQSTYLPIYSQMAYASGTTCYAGEVAIPPSQMYLANNVLSGNAFGYLDQMNLGNLNKVVPNEIIDGGGNSCAPTIFGSFPLACGRPQPCTATGPQVINVGQNGTYTEYGSVAGNAFWIGTRNGVNDTGAGVLAGPVQGNGSQTSWVYAQPTVGNYTRSLQIRDSNNNVLCQTQQLVIYVQ